MTRSIRHVRWLLPTLFALGALVPAAICLAQPPCPADTLHVYGRGLGHSAPEFSYIGTTPTWAEIAFEGPNLDVTAIDLQVNWAAGSGNCYLFDRGGRLRMEERFRLSGVAAGSSLSLQAVLEFTASGSEVPRAASDAPEGVWTARLASGVENASWSRSYDTSSGLSEGATLTLPVTLHEGEDTALVWEFEQFVVGGASRMSGRLHFEGLPEGVEILSCRGYFQLGVPVRTVTWGDLKARP